MAVGLRLFTDRVGDGAGAPVIDSDNGEELIYVQAGVSIVLANRPPESPGTLYISTKQVVWLSDLDRVKGYAVDFLSVSLHAVSRDPEAFPSPCIYIQVHYILKVGKLGLASLYLVLPFFLHHCYTMISIIDTEGDDEDESWGLDSESNETLGLSNIKEMRLVPSDPNQLDTLFGIFCRCVELNPEPIEEEEETHNWIFSADQMEDEVIDGEDSEWPFFQNPTNSIGHSNGAHDLAHSVLEQLQITDERFEDAEEMEGDGNSSHH